MSQKVQTSIEDETLPDLSMPCEPEVDGQSDLARGMLLVISGPSGVGKDTIWKAAAASLPSFCKAVTCTTREQRSHEIEGVDYFFVSDAEFDRLIAEDQLLEWAKVHGKRYGVPAVPVLERLNAGHNVVCVIDVQGAMKVRSLFPTCLLVFLRPPKGRETDVLTQRLRDRAPLSDEELTRRINTASWELAQTQLYDYDIVNDDVAQTAEKLREIVLREKKKWSRNHPAL